MPRGKSKASQGGLTPPQTIPNRARFSKSQSQNTEETAGANQLHFCRTLLLRKSQITNCFKLGIPLHTIVCHRMPLHSFVAYHRIPLHTIAYHRIPSYTIVYICKYSYINIFTYKHILIFEYKHMWIYKCTPRRWKMTVPPPVENDPTSGK